MLAPSPAVTAVSNVAPVTHDGIYRHIRRLFVELWPRKTASALAVSAGTSIRQAERITAGHSDLSGGALINLLRSDHGGKVLDEIMRGSRAKWWKRVNLAQRLASLERDQELQRLELQELRRQQAAADL